MLPTIKRFLARVPSSVAGWINLEELFRSIVTALGSGGGIGLLLTVVNAVLANVAVIFPDPVSYTLATMLLTLVVDLLRRLSHDGEPARPAV